MRLIIAATTSLIFIAHFCGESCRNFTVFTTATAQLVQVSLVDLGTLLVIKLAILYTEDWHDCMLCLDQSVKMQVMVVQVDQLSESLLFGWPNILIPHANSFDSSQEMQANEQGLAGLCQVGLITA